MKHYCETCFALIDKDGNGHKPWCKYYKPSMTDKIDIDDIFPGLSKIKPNENRKEMGNAQ